MFIFIRYNMILLQPSYFDILFSYKLSKSSFTSNQLVIDSANWTTFENKHKNLYQENLNY